MTLCSRSSTTTAASLTDTCWGTGRRAASQSFRVFAELDDRVVRVQGESRSLPPGVGGRAAIIVGRRSLVSYAFEPIRQMRENLASAR